MKNLVFSLKLQKEIQLPHRAIYSTIGEKDEHGGTNRKRAIEQLMSGGRS